MNALSAGWRIVGAPMRLLTSGQLQGSDIYLATYRLPTILVASSLKTAGALAYAGGDDHALRSCRDTGYVNMTDADRFLEWLQRWTALGDYAGEEAPDCDSRIAHLIALWEDAIPGTWQRGPGDTRPRLLRKRYTRGDESKSPKTPEHQIEYEILVECWDRLVLFDEPHRFDDALNAFPLVKSPFGTRRGDVEADLLGTAAIGDTRFSVVGEVKDTHASAWRATVQNLLQVKLFRSNPKLAGFFRLRGLSSDSRQHESFGVVIAPSGYYEQNGQKVASVPPAVRLIEALQQRTDARIVLATWDRAGSRIHRFAGCCFPADILIGSDHV